MRHVQTILAALLAPLAFAAAPVVSLPAEVVGEPAAFVTVRAKLEGATAAKFVALDAGLSVFPAGMLRDETATVVVATKPGRYRIGCYAGNADGASEWVVTTVVIGTGTTPPPVDPVKPDPIAPIGEKFFFLVVRPPGPIAPALEKALTLPAWAEVRKAGHQMTDLPVNELPPGIPAPATVPSVLRYRYAADGKQLVNTSRAETPVPATDEGVKALLR